MKTRIIQPTEQKPETPIKYPCLMTDAAGSVVYATSKAGGVLLAGKSDIFSNDVSYHDAGLVWERFGYTPMRGKVVIEFDMEDGQ